MCPVGLSKPWNLDIPPTVSATVLEGGEGEGGEEKRLMTVVSRGCSNYHSRVARKPDSTSRWKYKLVVFIEWRRREEIKIKRRSGGDERGCLIKISRSTRRVDKYSTRSVLVSASYLSLFFFFFFLFPLSASTITRDCPEWREIASARADRWKWNSRAIRSSNVRSIYRLKATGKGRERTVRDPAPAITGCVFPSEITIDLDRLFHVPAYVNLILFFEWNLSKRARVRPDFVICTYV